MAGKLNHPIKLLTKKEILETAKYIVDNQYESGAIPWFKNGILDPWDHIESAMGLSVAGFLEEAKKAYRWIKLVQQGDGGVYPAYDDVSVVDDTRKESHHAPYLATGIYHYYCITKDTQFLYEMWENVEAAIEFALSLQSEQGEIYWAKLPGDKIYKDALITGCSSIYKSLECGILLAKELGIDKPKWIEARYNLKNAIKYKPNRFDRTWESKSRFAMDWFYPVMCGVYEGQEARNRLVERWDEFVEIGFGCRCVCDEPWITVAESCELIMALLSAGMSLKAIELFSWLHKNRLEDGSYWTGYQTKLNIFWPEERPTWTAGVLLLAVDALMKLSPAAKIFQIHHSYKTENYLTHLQGEAEKSSIGAY